jgi:hypothetical protein
LVLVGATVGVVLAVTGGRSEPKPTAPGTPAITEPVAVAAGSAADGGAPIAMRAGSSDPWATDQDPSMPPDTDEEPSQLPDDSDDDYRNDEIITPESVGFQLSAKRLEQVRRDCRASLKHAPKDVAGGYMGMGYAQCYCIVGDVENAKKILVKTAEKELRQAVRTACAMYGATLE